MLGVGVVHPPRTGQMSGFEKDFVGMGKREGGSNVSRR